MGVLGLFEKKDKIPDTKEFRQARMYDYSSEESRVATAEWAFDQARLERNCKEQDWMKQNDYYNFLHDTAKEMKEALDEANIPYDATCLPDPFIMVESQIVPDIPQPEFHGRDDDKDSEKARKRELAVRFVIENNRMDDKNTSNERRLRKYGDAFWKAFWDETMPCGPRRGDIKIADIPVEDIYVDPTVKELQEAEYVAYIYTIHKLKFWRIFHKELEAKGLTVDDILTNQYRTDNDLLAPYTRGTQCEDDTIQVMEFWFKQPFDDPNGQFDGGDIACTIQAGGVELKYIPKYWKNTGRQCKLYPFVHYWCIKDETQLYNKSEIETILAMVDAGDKELAIGLMNDAMMANDMILAEEGALVPGEEITNIPGSVVKVKQGRIGSVARLGGLGNGVNATAMVNWLQNQIQRTNRNYDTNNGQETARVTTASGLLQLRSDAAAQQELKKADRNKGFCRLYELIDWLCLEFYDEDRMLFIGAQKKGEEPETIKYNSGDFGMAQFTLDPLTGVLLDEVTGREIASAEEAALYYPRVDVTVTAGDALTKNPATTIEILDKLAAVQVTADNYKLLAAELDYLDIPQKNDIINEWKQKFEPVVPPEIMQALGDNPELLAMVQQAIDGTLEEEVPQAAPITQGAMIPDETALVLAQQEQQPQVEVLGLPKV